MGRSGWGGVDGEEWRDGKGRRYGGGDGKDWDRVWVEERCAGEEGNGKGSGGEGRGREAEGRGGDTHSACHIHDVADSSVLPLELLLLGHA